MSFAPEETENLFTYGALQREEVQLATFGRRLSGRPDMLDGHRLFMTEVRDKAFAAANGARQRTVQFTGNPIDSVSGFVFMVTKEELEHADSYEPTDYERVLIELRSGTEAWVYVQREGL